MTPPVILLLPGRSLTAAGDRLVPIRASQVLAEGLEMVQQVQLDGPHLLLQRRPGAAVGVIQAFLQSLDLSDPPAGG